MEDTLTTNTLTRLQGYRASRGKEAEAQAIFVDWAKHYGFNIEEIRGYEANRTKGDWVMNGKNIEVKSQNIGNYRVNFFELGEVTDKEYHTDGWDKLVEVMSEHGVDLTGEEGYEMFNFGFTPVVNGATAFYINRETELIYIYSSQRLLKLVAEGIGGNGIHRGRGNANKDTISTFIRNSQTTFQKINDEWVYTGQPELSTVLKALGAK